MPRVSEETFGAGDQRWLGSTHGIHECRSVAIDPTSFSPSDYPNGYLPSGTRVAQDGDRFVKFNPSGSDGTEVLAGFVFTDQKVHGAEVLNAPLLDHGKVRVEFLPGAAFDPTDVETTGLFVFIVPDGGGS